MSGPIDQIGAALEQPIPDVIEPLRGYRYWAWDQDGLSSFGGRARWEPGVALKARCLAEEDAAAYYERMLAIAMGGGDVTAAAETERHEAPSSPSEHASHCCGIYAYSTPEAAWENLDTQAGHPEQYVLGEVELYGKVWPHERGWRAEYARPVAFHRLPGWKPTIWGDPLDALARFYDVSVAEFPLGEAERAEITKARQDAEIAAAVASSGSTPLWLSQNPGASGFGVWHPGPAGPGSGHWHSLSLPPVSVSFTIDDKPAPKPKWLKRFVMRGGPDLLMALGLATIGVALGPLVPWWVPGVFGAVGGSRIPKAWRAFRRPVPWAPVDVEIQDEEDD